MSKLILTGEAGFIGMNFMVHNLKELQLHGAESLFGKYETIVLIDELQLIDHDGTVWMSKQLDLILENLQLYIETNPNMILKSIHTMSGLFELEWFFRDETTAKSIDVINFASMSHVDESIDNPSVVYTNNVNIIPELVEYIGIEQIRTFFHIRTDEEYGEITESQFDAGKTQFQIGDPLHPNNPYSASKASQTLLLESLAHTHGLDVKYFVLSNQFGLFQHNSKFIPTIIRSICERKKIPVYGDGSNVREWTFVESTVEVITEQMLMNHSTNCQKIFHISDPNGSISNIDLIEIITSHMEEKHQLSALYEFIEDRKGHDYAYGLESTVKLDYDWSGALEDTIDFYFNLYKYTK